MKRLSKKNRFLHKRYLIVLEGKKVRRKARIGSDKPRCKSKLQNYSDYYQVGIDQEEWSFSRDGRVVIDLPEYFCLYKNSDETLEVIQNLRQACLIEGRRARLDLSNTAEVEAPATLLLYSMVDYILIRSGDPQRISIVYPATHKVEQVCQQIGLLKRLGMENRIDPSGFFEDVSRWKVQYGNLVEGKQIHNFIVDILQDAGKETVSRYNKGLKEAIGNCVEHAYINEQGVSDSSDFSRWWMFGGFMDGHVVFVVCDLGMGIPRTLNIRNDMTALRRKIMRWPGKFDMTTDSGKIEVACRLGKSRIGEAKGRGRGLAQLIDLMQFSSKSSLCIWSNKGVAVYSSLKGEKPIKNKLKYSVRGTLISWSSPAEN